MIAPLKGRRKRPGRGYARTGFRVYGWNSPHLMSHPDPPPVSRMVPVVTDPLPGVLLQRAKGGDRDACHRLLGWAYRSARDYYGRKVGVEVLLSPVDAEELAGMFFIEFERAWPRIQSVRHYTRRMLRNNLRRYLRRKRERRVRVAQYSGHDLDLIPASALHVAEPHPMERWSDDEASQFAAVRETLARSDPLTRNLMALRSGDPPLSYAVIAVRLRSTETALRMRAARFYRAVRDTHKAMACPRT